MEVSVRWRFGENEVEVTGDETFVEKQLTRFESRLEELASAGAKQKQPRGRILRADFDGDLSPAEFYRKLKPNSGVESLVVLGKYLHDFRKQPNFTKADMRAIAGETRIKEIHPQYYSLALQRGLLRELDGGLAVTLSGDELVHKLTGANISESEE